MLNVGRMQKLAESYMPLIILYTSIISPRQRLYLSVGKFKNFNRSLCEVCQTDDMIWLWYSRDFYLWCRWMFGFGCQQYMFTLDVVDYVTFICLIYGEYLVNVHFSDIPHTFIPQFTLHSAEKNPHQIFRKLPVDNFPHSAIRIPQNTPSLNLDVKGDVFVEVNSLSERSPVVSDWCHACTTTFNCTQDA